MNASQAKRIGIVVNSHTSQVGKLPTLLKKVREALKGFDTSFQIAYGPKPLVNSPFTRLPPYVDFLSSPCAQGEGAIRGFNALISKQNHPGKLIYTNFDHLELILPKLPELVLRIGKKAVVARWDPEAHLYMPHSQFVAETALSYALTYASPAHLETIIPSWENREEFEAKSKGDTLLNAYLGLAGITSEMWGGIAGPISALFSGSFESLKKAGIDAGMVLALLHKEFEIDNTLELPKRYEHEHYERGSEGEKKYALSRYKHFLMETDVVLEFAQKTDGKKTGPLETFVNETINIILNAGFHWPGRDVRKSGENKGKSSFMGG